MTRIDLAVADQGANGTFLSACKQREEGGALVFQSEFALGEDPSSKRALIVSPYLPTPTGEQVFLLPIPRRPKPRVFTEWQHPNFMAKGAGLAIMFNKKVDIVSTNIPPDCFEVRYKIETRDLGPDWTPDMKRKSGSKK